MRGSLQRVAMLILGWALIVLGIAGLFLPFLQGILLLVAGVWVLSRESAWVRRRLDRLRARYPRLAEVEDRAKTRLHAWRERWSRRRGPPEARGTRGREE